MMEIQPECFARVWLLGDNVNTDTLHPPEYFSFNDARLKEGIRQAGIRMGTSVAADEQSDSFVIVAGENFGCGSSRETSVRALVACGLRAVVARSFGRIFFRSLINLGIPAIACSGIQDRVRNGDRLNISLADGYVALEGKGRFACEPLDHHVSEILACNGLLAYLHRERHGL